MAHKIVTLSAIFLFAFVGNKLIAQEAVVASGGNVFGSGGSVSYSLGQVFYTVKPGAAGEITEGVQQPFEIFVITGIEETTGISISCRAYPNPTTGFLNLKIDGDIQENYIAALYNMDGKLIKTQNILGSLTSIDIGNFVSATYLLKVVQTINSAGQFDDVVSKLSQSRPLKTFKIIKK